MEYQGVEYTVSHAGDVTAFPIVGGFASIVDCYEPTDMPAAVIELCRMETITDDFTRFVVTEETDGRWTTQLLQAPHPIKPGRVHRLAEGVGDTELESIEKCLAEAVDIFTI